jgi:GTP cyclohydrolase IB
MNIHTPEIDRKPTRDEAEAALAVLRQWAGKASDDEIAALDPAVTRLAPQAGAADYPVFSRAIPKGFAATTPIAPRCPICRTGRPA